MANREFAEKSAHQLEELIALNDEIAGLVRAGIPLEAGLGAEFSSKLGPVTDRLRERLGQGLSLPEALAAEESNLPRVYRAIVEAGLRTGKLPQALESLSVAARAIVALRRRIALAMIYPMIVLCATYLMFLLLINILVPRYLATVSQFNLPERWWLKLFSTLHETVGTWGWIVPIGAVAALLIWGWWNVGNAMPWMHSIRRYFQWSSFAELLGILIDHGVPLPDALRLSAEATGNKQLEANVGEIAGDVASGSTLTDSLKQRRTLPPFMQWMMASGEQRGGLPSSLRQVTEVYRRRANMQSALAKTLLPVLFVVVLGGGLVLVYALVLFLPLTDIYADLARPNFS